MSTDDTFRQIISQFADDPTPRGSSAARLPVEGGYRRLRVEPGSSSVAEAATREGAGPGPSSPSATEPISRLGVVLLVGGVLGAVVTLVAWGVHIHRGGSLGFWSQAGYFAMSYVFGCAGFVGALMVGGDGDDDA